LKEWISALIKSFLTTASYVLGALLAASPVPLSASLGVVVFGVTFASEFATGISPARKLDEAAPIIMDEFAAPLMDLLRGRNLKPRMNVLIPKRTWRWLWFRRYFRVEWSLGMENHPDVNIQFPLTSGVAGECFRTKRPAFANMAQIGQNLRLPPHVERHTAHLKAIFSYPIYEPKKRGHQSGRLLGVLNLDSEVRHAYNALTSQRMLGIVDEEMKKIAIMAGLFFR
jgi:hypothetical protein